MEESLSRKFLETWADETMPEPLTIYPVGEPPGSPVVHDRRSLLRRLLALLTAGGVAFALTTWTLVRYDDPFGPLGWGARPAGPADVVKAHLEALNRGELRAAYALFSRQYRAQFSFEDYRRLLLSHRQIFRTREIRVSRQQESGQRALLETQILTEGGEHYQARFTLVRAEGRWWIDDVRWGAEPALKGRVTV